MPMNNATSSRTWTPEQDAVLTKLWSDGRSGGDIAWEMGKTRNAIIGRAHRLKLHQTSPHARVRQITRPQGRGGQKGNPGQAKAKGIVSRVRARALADRQHAGNQHFRPGSLPPEDDGGVDVTHLVAFRDRRIHHECSHIIGDAGPGAKCCGKPVKPGTEWCEFHYRRVYGRAAAD